MKLLPILLVNMLVTGGGLVIYDQLRDDAPAQTPSEDVELSLEPELIEDTTTRVEQAELIGSGTDSLFRDLEKQKREIAELRGLVAKLVKSGGDISAIEGGTAGPLPSMELPDLPEDAEPEDFDERTIRVLRQHLDEIERQRRQERVVEGINRQLERLGVELSDTQRDDVVAATVTMRDKIRDVWRNARGLDEEGRAALREEMTKVQDEYKTSLYNFLPASDADKIVEGMGNGGGRAFGMTGGRRGGGPRGGGGGGR